MAEAEEESTETEVEEVSLYSLNVFQFADYRIRHFSGGENLRALFFLLDVVTNALECLCGFLLLFGRAVVVFSLKSAANLSQFIINL